MTTNAEEPPRLLPPPLHLVVGATPPLLTAPWPSPWLPLLVLEAFLRGLAQVCFANNAASGALVAAALWWAAPGGALLLAAALCSCAALAAAKALGGADGAVRAGLGSYSAVLVGTVGLALRGAAFAGPRAALAWACLALAGAYSAALGPVLGRLLRPLPFLTLPFNIATAALFLAIGQQATEAEQSPDAAVAGLNSTAPAEGGAVPDVLWGWMLSAGQVYAVEHAGASALVWAALLLCSPALCVSSGLGGLVGTLVGQCLEGGGAVRAGVWGYNALLAAACPAFFLRPAVGLLPAALLSALTAALLQAAMAPLLAVVSLPVFTLPFCGAGLLTLSLCSHSPGLQPCPTFPEEHLYWAWRQVRARKAARETADV